MELIIFYEKKENPLLKYHDQIFRNLLIVILILFFNGKVFIQKYLPLTY